MFHHCSSIGRYFLILAMLFQSFSNIRPPASVPNQPETKNASIAYLHFGSAHANDDLKAVTERADSKFAYQEFTPENISQLWQRLPGYRVLLIEWDSRVQEVFTPLLQPHQKDLQDFLKAGGRLFVSIYGDDPGVIDWLPVSLAFRPQAPSSLSPDASETTRLLTKPNNLPGDYFAQADAERTENIFVLSGAGYSPVLHTNDRQGMVLAYQTFGSGLVIVSGGKFEAGFHPEWVENVIDPLPIIVVVVGKILIEAVATYLITEYIVKPAVRPEITAIGKKYNITQIDEDAEADALVDIASLAFSLSSIWKTGSKGIAQYGLAQQSTGKAVGGHMRWAYEFGARALYKADVELTQQVIVDPAVKALTQPQKDDLTSRISTSLKPRLDISNPASYPYYLENTLPYRSYVGVVDPIAGYQQKVQVPAGATAMRIYISWDYMFCGPAFALLNPLDMPQYAIPNYPSINAVELKVGTPMQGEWTVKVLPLTQLQNREVGIVVNIDQPHTRVLFDASHDEYFSANNDWSIFANELRKQGFGVDVLNTSPITYDKLKEYKAFVFGGWAHTQLTTAEVSAINQYVQDGGGLLLAYDEFTSNVYNPISSIFGAEFIDEAGLDDPTDGENGSNAPVLHVFSTHPLFYKVRSVQFYWVHYLSKITQPSSAVLFTDSDTVNRYGAPAANKPMVSVARSGNGRVVMIPDANLWNNWDWDADGSADLYDRDNLQFGFNVISWLAKKDPIQVLSSASLAPMFSQQPVSPSGGEPHTGSLANKPQTPMIQPSAAGLNAAAVSVATREHEQATLDAQKIITRLVNTIATYGNGIIEVTDTVPSTATLTFSQPPDTNIISGAQRILTWRPNVDGYYQISYTVENIVTAKPDLVDASLTLLNTLAPLSQQSTAYLNLMVNAKQDLEQFQIEFDIPKNGSTADLSLGETEVAAVTDAGTYYHVSVTVQKLAKGTQFSTLIPVLVSPKKVGTESLAVNGIARASQKDLVFLQAASTTLTGNKLVSRGVEWSIPNLSIQITSQPVAFPALIGGTDHLLLTVSQAETSINGVYVENVGNKGANLGFALAFPESKPDGWNFLPVDWVTLPPPQSIAAGAEQEFKFSLKIPQTASVGEYVATLKVNSENQSLSIPVLISVTELGLIKHLHGGTNVNSLALHASQQVTTCFTDDFGQAVANVQVLFTGAGVDVGTQVLTENNGCVSTAVMAQEFGMVEIAGIKQGYVDGLVQLNAGAIIYLPKVDMR